MATVEIDIVGKDSFSGVLSNFGNIMTGIKSTIDLVAGAFNAVVDFGSQFTDEAIESQNAIANLEATLRSMGNVTGLSSQQLQDMAGALQEVTRFSDETIMNGQAMLLTFGNIGGDIFPRATEAMLDLASKFGSVDQASVMLGKALNDPIAGVTALRRVGVQLSEEQEASIKLFMEQGDIMSAQGIILAELERQVGGLAEAYGDTFAGKLDIFKNRIGEVKETIGNSLLPILSQLMDWAAQFLPTIETLGGKIAGVFDAIATTGIGSAEFQQALGELDVFIGEILQKIADGINGWIESGGPEQLSDAIVSVVDGLSGDVELQSATTRAAVNIARALGNAFAQIDWGAILSPIGQGIDNTLNNFFVDLLNINEIKAGWQQIGEDLINGISVGMSDGISGLIANATRFWQNIIANAKAVLGIASPSTVFAQIGRDIISGLIGGFTGMAGALLSAVGNIVDDVVSAFQPVIDLITGGDGSMGGQLGTHAGAGSTGSTGTGAPGTGPGGTTTGTGAMVVNQYFAGANITIGSWDEIAYDCIYPNPFVSATSGQLGSGGGGGGAMVR